jgi:hypothetical protein
LGCHTGGGADCYPSVDRSQGYCSAFAMHRAAPVTITCHNVTSVEVEYCLLRPRPAHLASARCCCRGRGSPDAGEQRHCCPGIRRPWPLENSSGEADKGLDLSPDPRPSSHPSLLLPLSPRTPSHTASFELLPGLSKSTLVKQS